MGPFDIDGVVGGIDEEVGEEVSEGVCVGVGVGDELFVGVKPGKETIKKPINIDVKTRTVTAIYCFFMMKLNTTTRLYAQR